MVENIFCVASNLWEDIFTDYFDKEKSILEKKLTTNVHTHTHTLSLSLSLPYLFLTLFLCFYFLSFFFSPSLSPSPLLLHICMSLKWKLAIILDRNEQVLKHACFCSPCLFDKAGFYFNFLVNCPWLVLSSNTVCINCPQYWLAAE